MMYEKMKISIKSAFRKTTNSSVSSTEHSAHKVLLHIDPETNKWNRVAIKLSEENTKVPSRWQEIDDYPTIPVKNASKSTPMTTNEWNGLALELKHARCEESEQVVVIFNWSRVSWTTVQLGGLKSFWTIKHSSS